MDNGVLRLVQTQMILKLSALYKLYIWTYIMHPGFNLIKFKCIDTSEQPTGRNTKNPRTETGSYVGAQPIGEEQTHQMYINLP